jgi:hypothetical protein
MTVYANIGDTHAPYQDKRAIELACLILEEVKPDVVVHHADDIDFYALSSFCRDPARVTKLQEELNSAFRMNKRLTSATPESLWRLLNDGNHEARLWRYLCAHPEIAGLDALSLENLLRLEELGWELVPPITEMDNTLAFTHGEAVSKHAAYDVKKDLENVWFQQSIVRAHSHRTSCYTIRGPNSSRAGYVIGCLCTLTPEYRAHPNWLQGMAITTVNHGKFDTFSVENLIFSGTDRSRRVIFRGKEFVA